MAKDFFEEQLPCSKIKSKIVSTYFLQWASVIKRHAHDKIGYLDFFCGPGKYEDGSDSTPLLILKSSIRDADISNKLVAIFNDKDKSNIDKLENEIAKLDGLKSLKYKPIAQISTISDEVVKQIKKIEFIPSLIFIDPWGYKGLSLELIGSVIKDWGCDCIFFFNYNRINAAISNPFMKDNVDAIFGENAANKLRNEVQNLSPEKREQLVLATFMESLKTINGNYSLQFKFYNEDGTKTSHFLIFVNKHALGYHLMKETMANNCETNQGVPTYEFNPQNDGRSRELNLFSAIDNPMITLCEDLLVTYSGKTMTMDEIYQGHNLFKPYIKANYKMALLRLEREKKVTVNPSKDHRRKIKGQLTMGDNVKITFN